MSKSVYGEYFYGNKISDYGLERGYVDYATLAKAFDAVLNNTIINKVDYWEPYCGSACYYEDTNGNIYANSTERDERIDELEEERKTLILERDNDSECESRIVEIEADIEALDEEYYYNIYQYYIISDGGAELLSEWTNEIVLYNEELDIYLWCVTHYGTSWSSVLTDIKCDVSDKAFSENFN